MDAAATAVDVPAASAAADVAAQVGVAAETATAADVPPWAADAAPPQHRTGASTAVLAAPAPPAAKPEPGIRRKERRELVFLCALRF